jgi:hypothetical protein
MPKRKKRKNKPQKKMKPKGRKRKIFKKILLLILENPPILSFDIKSATI